MTEEKTGAIHIACMYCGRHIIDQPADIKMDGKTSHGSCSVCGAIDHLIQVEEMKIEDQDFIIKLTKEASRNNSELEDEERKAADRNLMREDLQKLMDGGLEALPYFEGKRRREEQAREQKKNLEPKIPLK